MFHSVSVLSQAPLERRSCALPSVLFVIVFPVERANQAVPVGPVPVSSEESQHQSLHEKQARQSSQEIMAQTEGGSSLASLKNRSYC